MSAQTEVEQHTPQLQLLPTPSGREPIPDSYAPGEQAFAKAYDQSLAGKHAEAAAGFLEAAEILRAPPNDRYADSMSAARGVAYFNAWEAFQAAGQRELGKQKLEKAAKADRGLTAEIRKILAG